MISIAYQGIAAPFHWTLLPKRGNSNTAERTELVQRFISFFGEGCIEAILPDREFIGDVWFRALIHRKIPFYIRIRYNLWIDIPGKGPTSSFW
jgi:hypothetical protein